VYQSGVVAFLPYRQTSLCHRREDTGIRVPHDERLLEGDTF
jgi:hypothetical protein